MLEKIFKLKEHKTHLYQEILAGLTTFMTMSYIIFIQPYILSKAGMDFGAVMVATCLASCVACWIMAFAANYPIGLAPGMGENFFFTFNIVLAHQVGWETALGAVFISGVLFLILTLIRIRQMIVDAVPDCLKYAIGAGIGLFIALIGFKEAGFAVNNPGGLIQLGDFRQPAVWIGIAGILLTLILLLRRIKGAILIGILGTTLLALLLKLIHFEGIVSLPPSIRPTFLKFDLLGAIHLDFVIIVLLLFMVMFDTIGTLIGVGSQAGLLKDGKIPKVSQALLADAAGTTLGASLGTSSIVCYIESAAGVREGGRTGLTAFVVGLCFLGSIFFAPLAKLIGGGISLSNGQVLHPITAPALILVGSMMLKGIRQIQWDDEADAIPSFLVLVGIPFTFSIADGIALGLITYPIAQIVRGRRVPLFTWILALFFILRYVLG